MRVQADIVLKAPPQEVWDYVAEPTNYLDFMVGFTRWEIEGKQRAGLGARYRMLMKVGSAEVGGLIEIVEFDPPRDLAWNSVMGLDQRGRWRLREVEGGTRVTLRLVYVTGGGIPGLIAERVAAHQVRRNLEGTLLGLKRAVESQRLRAARDRARALA